MAEASTLVVASPFPAQARTAQARTAARTAQGRGACRVRRNLWFFAGHARLLVLPIYMSGAVFSGGGGLLKPRNFIYYEIYDEKATVCMVQEGLHSAEAGATAALLLALPPPARL